MAPKVRPEIMYFWVKPKKRKAGIKQTIETAAISPQSVPAIVANFTTPGVMVLAFVLVKILANNISFQLNKKTRTAATAIVGLASGMMIFHRILR